MDTHRVRNMYSENKQSETSCISLVIYLQDFKDARYHEHKKKTCGVIAGQRPLWGVCDERKWVLSVVQATSRKTSKPYLAFISGLLN